MRKREEAILASIEQMGARVSQEISCLRLELLGRMDELERRQRSGSRKIRRMQQAQEMQQAEIEALTKRVEALTETDAIWRSPKGDLVGVDKDSCYDAFEELGISRRQAMLILRDLEKIALDSQGKMTVPVRNDADGRLVRAVVVRR